MWPPNGPVTEIGERNHGVATYAQHMLEHDARMARSLQSLRQDHVIERVVGIIRQVRIGVALDDSEPLGHAFVDAFARELYPAAIVRSCLRRVSIAVNLHPRGGASPRVRAAPSRNPRTIANSSGSSSRKASWPLSVSTSANETRAPPALSACTIARESEVGKSQSDVKEMTQNRVGVSLKAFANAPS